MSSDDARPLLVFFSSAQSGPSRRMESLVAHIARKERDRLRVIQVDVDQRADLVDEARRQERADARARDRPQGRRAPRRPRERAAHRGDARGASRAARSAGELRSRATLSSRAITASVNAAARAPSTTRWSNVTLMLPIVRTTISPSRTTARGAMRCTPRMPTSGWLTSGVTNRPASLPALVTVKVEPRRSSGASLPVARLLRRARRRRRVARRAARVAAAHDGHDEPLVGLDGDAEVVAVEVDDLVALEARVQLGELLQRQRRRTQHERQQLLQVDAGEVALLDVGDGGDLAVRARQVLDDLPADAAHLLAPPLGLVAGTQPAAARTSSSVIRPPGPVGVDRCERRPRAPARSAARAASPAPAALARCDRPRGQSAWTRPLRASSTAGVAPSSSAPITTSTVPTGTTSPSATRMLRDACPRPATGSRPSSCRSGSRRAAGPRRSRRRLGDEPARDLALGQALAEVGQLERVRHGGGGYLRGRPTQDAGRDDQHAQALAGAPERDRQLVARELRRDLARHVARPAASAPRSRRRRRSGRARSRAPARAPGARRDRTIASATASARNETPATGTTRIRSSSQLDALAGRRVAEVVARAAPVALEPEAEPLAHRQASSRSTACTPTCSFTTCVTRRSTTTLARPSASSRRARAPAPSAPPSRRRRSSRRGRGARRNRR